MNGRSWERDFWIFVIFTFLIGAGIGIGIFELIKHL